MSVKTITPADVYRLHQESGAIALIDVRESDEFEEMAAPISENMPLTRFRPEEVKRSFDVQTPIYVICRSGRRSLKAAELLVASGFKSVHNVTGGILEWQRLGLPMTGSQLRP